MFNAEMVRAILDGRKTQTRRVVKPQPEQYGADGAWLHPATDSEPQWATDLGDAIVWASPYQVGDVLWVRETFFEAGNRYQEYPGDDEYRGWSSAGLEWYSADGPPPVVGQNDWGITDGFHHDGRSFFPVCGGDYWRKRPSIHMPKWAARTFMRVTDVRVERIQDISDDDAKTEGALDWFYALSPDEQAKHFCDCSVALDGDKDGPDSRDAFAMLWDSLAKPGTTWADNPLVWAYSFERCEKPEGWPHA